PTVCAVCNGPKATKTCRLCEAMVCKKCIETLGTDAFVLLPKIPIELSHSMYCARCYDTHVAAPFAAYEEIAAKAEGVYFVTRDYNGYVHVIERHTTRVSVEICEDRRITILKMAYLAAQLGFNAIIDAKVQSFSYNLEGGYQSARWKGSSLPAKIDGAQLERTSLMRI
ncbi:MAG: hypothetical protein ABIR96_12215, partial [Bdellovibrionota bacterium]